MTLISGVSRFPCHWSMTPHLRHVICDQISTKEEKQVAIKLMCVDTLTRLLDNCSPPLDSDWETAHIEWYHWWTSNKQHREWICEEDLGWCQEEARIMNWSGQLSHLWTDSILTRRISASSQSTQVLWVRYVTFSFSVKIFHRANIKYLNCSLLCLLLYDKNVIFSHLMEIICIQLWTCIKGLHHFEHNWILRHGIYNWTLDIL